ncbi:Sodium/hydrogen exchanger family-domain-containing protein [Irpex rosettiformis]|uniref:Sodium/hydrogen exchanger family-domain-containing protein n=1 Tax=Irpex rosettiformis TaxID=378272 RepID=A0ACB8TY17_9APHY|nr:Sodium/hydrogen exchanger family-domain-containing protein [Irpex rosettiformis]
MHEFSEPIVNIVRAALFKRAATEQGGLLSGQDPTVVNTADPIRLWIIQVGVIVMTTQILALGLRKIRQPKVIAEVIGGILLGPTAFGRIPGFQEHIFPKESISYLSLVANIGLCLFLFLVGLEIDAQVIKRNAKLSFTVALAGMSLPFGLGAALSVPLYHQFIDPSIKFTNFMLFTGVAYSITAFPVLCRILTELKLLDTTVGIVVLSAGVGNDIIGWTLLALSVALVNGGAGVEALYILLVCVGWTLVLLFPIKYVMRWLAIKTGSIQNGPTMFFMTVTILLLFGSAFFTDIIGVHAIFGAFLAGIIVPREGGLAIALTEKLEDMVSIIFLPLYFTLSGLSTDLGLLNNGITWGYTVAICALAYSGKFGGCTIAARWSGFSWRESSTIGSLMSCKGLVELIVLNVGLSAGILSQRVFSMFVLEALLLTFMTTPAVVLLYPPEKRKRVTAMGVPFDNIADVDKPTRPALLEGTSSEGPNKPPGFLKTRFTVVLDQLEHVPGMMALTQLLQPPPSQLTRENARDDITDVHVEALRLIELSDRTSAVMKSSVWDTLIHTDPLLSIFRTFGELNGMAVSTSLAVVSFDDLASSVSEIAGRTSSQLVLMPWLPPYQDRDAFPTTPAVEPGSKTNPFDNLFRSANAESPYTASALHSQFVRGVFSQSKTDVALFVGLNNSGEATKISTGATGTGGRYHLFLPFFGGPDDRLALEFVVQLCAHPKVTATVARVVRVDPAEMDLRHMSIDKPPLAHVKDDGDANARENMLTVTSTAFPDTQYGYQTTQTRLQSETADYILWQRYSAPSSDAASFDSATSDALSRIEWQDVHSANPLRSAVEITKGLEASTAQRRSRLLLIAGRSRRLAAENHHVELKGLLEEYGSVPSEVKKTVGDVASAFISTKSEASVIVLQAANVSTD